MQYLIYTGRRSPFCLTNSVIDRVNVLFIYFQRNEVGPEEAEYAFPEVVLNYIRHLVPCNIKGEIRQVSVKCFYFNVLLS